MLALTYGAVHEAYVCHEDDPACPGGEPHAMAVCGLFDPPRPQFTSEPDATGTPW